MLWTSFSITLVSHASIVYSSAIYPERAMVPFRGIQSPIEFGSYWQTLGPFQIGTREATWGADPLENLGGFRALEYDPGARFRSSLGTDGTVKWSLVDAVKRSSAVTGANASLSLGFPNVDWTSLQAVYGWAALQYQAWSRGQIVVHANEPNQVVLYTDNILEYWIDGVHYFGGDFYAFRKAPPVIQLEPGVHTIDIRLIRDVRAMGGVGSPSIEVGLEAKIASERLEVAKEGILVADVVDGHLASPYASVYVRNTKIEDVEIVGVESQDATVTMLPLRDRFVVCTGQTRPVAFTIGFDDKDINSTCVRLRIVYKSIRTEAHSTLEITQDLRKQSIQDPHKITYLQANSIVSYAILRSPSGNATCHSKEDALPVLLGLHGAGLEADSDLVAHALDPVPDLCAWVLFPTGVTSWSGDDWHKWGFTDVEHAIQYIPAWIKAVKWAGPGVNVFRWLVSGHSNGGQGTWFALTHRPDQVIAAAPVSGYSSIQKYVSYEMWHPMDPRRTAIMSASMNSYRHEMLMENCHGIPILQQHGSKDDNVPPYHSRFLGQLLSHAGIESHYYELPGKGHWFDGVMTTDQLRQFYRDQTTKTVDLTQNAGDFSVVVASPADMGAKNGIRVLQLEDPGQYGRVDVSSAQSSTPFQIRTSNVLSLEIDSRLLKSNPLKIDSQDLLYPQYEGGSEGSETAMVSKNLEGYWAIGARFDESAVNYRRGRQLGAMDAILRSKGTFTIRYQGSKIYHLALQVSRNLHQYFSADSVITEFASQKTSGSGNVITLAIGAELPPSAHTDFSIQVGATGIKLRDNQGVKRTYTGDGRLAAAFLRPLEGERLELVLWGLDQDSLAIAARFVPMITGVGQPDFIILEGSSRWRGAQGALSMGFFDHMWNVTKSSVIG